MGFLSRFRRGDSREPVRLLAHDNDEDEFIDSFDPSELPYASEFELPREEARLRAVYEHERRGGNFVIRKPYSNKGRTSRELLTLDRFPLFDEVVQAVEELYGGGTYNVSPANSQRVLKSYAVEGPPKSGTLKESNAGGRGASPGGMTVKQRLDIQAERELDGLLQNDSELGRTLAGAILKKQFGVELPGVTSYEDRLFQNELESNPEYRQQYLEAALKNKGVKPRKDVEVDEFDRIIIALEKAQKLKDAMGHNGGDGADGTSWRGVMQDAIKAGAEFLKAGGTLPFPGAGGAPAISQQQALSPVAEERVQAPPRPPEPRPSPEPPIPQRQRVMGMSQSEQTPERFPQEAQPAQPAQPAQEPAVDLADIDWMALLPQVDWSELEAQANGDPGDFMQAVYSRYYEHDSEPHGILRDLFLNNSPNAIVGAFVDAGQMLSKPWVMGMARMIGKGDDVECAGRIIQRLTKTAEGQQWIAEASAAARIIEQRLLEVEAAGEVPSPLLEAVESEESDSQMLMHSALHGVLEGGDEDEDPNQIL